MDVSDIFIIGGGINGTAIAADAAGRGLTVTLCEKNDLASGTSSASTKLIHGGLRYLELYDFKLVRHALREREILLRKAPNLITPLEFVLPHEKHLRPAWIIQFGLFLYDHLVKRNLLPSSKLINLKTDPRGDALKSEFLKGFSYFDCYTDDSRLVILNALTAKEHNATIVTRTEFVSAIREDNHWRIKLNNIHNQQSYFCFSKTLINAAGPWINPVQNNIAHATHEPLDIKLVKGSHIVVPKLYEGDFAYILQNQDNRIVFTIPFHQKFTLIGTTDVTFKNNPDHIDISLDEKNYLCTVSNRYFKKSISEHDIVWSYAGVRCLQDDNKSNASNVTREHKLQLESENNLPYLTVIGGKLTTHRVLAEEALDALKPYFPHMKPAWTAFAPFPGCDFEDRNFELFFEKIKNQFNWLPHELARHYAVNYGTRALLFLENCKSISDLGELFTNVLYQKEIEYLIQHEWAESADDILWRRTKQGLFISESNKIKLQHWIDNYFSR